MKKLSTLVLSMVLTFLVARPALAVTVTNPDANYFLSFTDNSFKGILVFFVTKIFLPFAGTIAILFIIVGGYQYMTAGVNEELAEQGKKTLRNAVIGLAIIILSYLIVNAIITALASSS